MRRSGIKSSSRSAMPPRCAAPAAPIQRYGPRVDALQPCRELPAVGAPLRISCYRPEHDAAAEFALCVPSHGCGSAPYPGPTVGNSGADCRRGAARAVQRADLLDGCAAAVRLPEPSGAVLDPDYRWQRVLRGALGAVAE